MMQTILILKTGKTISNISPGKGDFEDWIIQAMGLPPEVFTVVNTYLEEMLPSCETLDGIVVTGSPAMVTEKLAWSEYSSVYLKKAFEYNIPILGICYGHQLLAQALGGEVGFHPLGREIGTVSIKLSADGKVDALFHGLPETFLVNVSHSQSVLKISAQTKILAANDFEPHHCLRFGDQAWGVQFHPEFDAEVMTAYLQGRRHDLELEGLDTSELLQRVEQTPFAEKLLLNFANIIYKRTRSQ